MRCDAGFDFFGSERAKGSRKKHLEFVADLKAREGFDFFGARSGLATQGSNFARAVRARARGFEISVQRSQWRAACNDWGHHRVRHF